MKHIHEKKEIFKNYVNENNIWFIALSPLIYIDSINYYYRILN